MNCRNKVRSFDFAWIIFAFALKEYKNAATLEVWETEVVVGAGAEAEAEVEAEAGAETEATEGAEDAEAKASKQRLLKVGSEPEPQ